MIGLWRDAMGPRPIFCASTESNDLKSDDDFTFQPWVVDRVLKERQETHLSSRGPRMRILILDLRSTATRTVPCGVREDTFVFPAAGFNVECGLGASDLKLLKLSPWDSELKFIWLLLNSSGTLFPCSYVYVTVETSRKHPVDKVLLYF